MADRQEILKAIKRIAADDGRPPGRRTFERITGLKESDWMGRYWARWSDALTEAGFEPNEKQGRRSDDDLLRHLALFTLQLRRFPTSAEMRMKARDLAGFPSHNTYSRFGSRTQLQLRLDRYCETNPEFEHVRSLLVLSNAVDPADATTATASNGPTDGQVYLVRLGRHYKIGRTNDVGRRSYEIGLQLPEKPTLVHTIHTDDPVGIEAYWHSRFADFRTNGEWFKLSGDQVRAFKRRKFM